MGEPARTSYDPRMSLDLAVIACGLAAGICHPLAEPAAHSAAVRLTASSPARVRLAVRDVPRGWIASFCTPRTCSPFRTTLTLPSGSTTLQISFIPVTDAPQPLRALHLVASSATGHAEQICRLERTIVCTGQPPSPRS
jgi:hypothetical protein